MHKLSMTEVEVLRMQEDDPVAGAYVDYSDFAPDQSGRKRVWWQEDLINTVAQAHFCRIMIVEKSSVIFLVGRESDRQVAVYVFEVLSRTILKLGRAGYRKARKNGEFTRGYFTAFHAGFVHRIRERYKEERRRIEDQLPPAEKGTALMRLRNEETAVKKYVADLTDGKAGAVGSGRITNQSAYSDGRSAGDGAAIRGNAVGTSGKTARRLSK